MPRSSTRFGRALALSYYYGLASHLPDLAFPGGRMFNAARCSALRRILPVLGAQNEIDAKVYIGDGSDVSVGSRCQINRGCRLNRVRIGDCVMLGPEVVVVGQLHEAGRTDVPMIDQGKYTKRETVIEDDVWIGIRATIMPGVTIAKGAVVGAGAVVTKDVPAYTVVAGVPARPIRSRLDTQSEAPA
jgi:maltose O-acetyltransferase